MYCTQEPFDTLNAELLEDLTETQHHQLDQALPKYDLGTLLSTLYEFIETYIRHIDMNMKKLGLAIVHTCIIIIILYLFVCFHARVDHVLSTCVVMTPEQHSALTGLL